jgi:putative ABC transport system permease protein
MKTRYAIQEALRGIRRHRSRTFLTLLGIAVAIAAVVIILSLGKGVTALVTDEIEGLGADQLEIQPGREPKGPADITQIFLSKSLTERDLVALRKKGNVPHAVRVEPFVHVPATAAFGSETYGRAMVMGGSVEFLGDVFKLSPAEGVWFTESDIKERAHVAVIGAKVKRELFGDAPAVGKRITLRDRKFRVVGVLGKEGQVAFANLDDMVVIPYTTAQIYLLGISHYNQINIRVDDPKHVRRTKDDIEYTLRESHRLKAGEENDFTVNTPEALVDQVRTILSSITIFLVAVVAVALVVGGIGIMNIMLVSVTERTREIGLRKAVGATEWDVRKQFLLEAVFVTLLGGVLGVAFGLFVAFVASLSIREFTDLSWRFVVPWAGSIWSLLGAFAVGLIFGIYPANLAAKKSPMEALRYE